MQFTYMQHMRNNNLEISPAASSVVPDNGLYLIQKISEVRATGSSMFYCKVLTKCKIKSYYYYYYYYYYLYHYHN